MRLSRQDKSDPSKRRHFEISIDSPLHILSCRATQANTALPAYSSAAPSMGRGGPAACQCPGSTSRPSSTDPSRASRTSSTPGRDHVSAAGLGNGGSITIPPIAHIMNLQRPIHLLRHPSFDPPAFDAEVPPPPLMSPPPRYESVVRDGNGLADYFSRLADESGDESPDAPPRTPGRINVPLTPGGRVNRSMDEPRTWLPPGQVS